MNEHDNEPTDTSEIYKLAKQKGIEERAAQAEKEAREAEYAATLTAAEVPSEVPATPNAEDSHS